MADLDETPQAINRYLIERVRKLEEMTEDLARRNAELLAFLMEWQDDYAERRESADAYFAILDRNRD